MTMKKQTAVVVCPGRGTYNQTELGYLKRYHGGDESTVEISAFLGEVEAGRKSLGQVSLSELDGSDKYKSRIHGTGDNASALIYACALADFKKIDSEKFDVIAVTGNSMGWYLALACAGVLPGQAGFDVVNTMGKLMHTEGRGGQVIYPLVDENWQSDSTLSEICSQTVADLNKLEGVEIFTSIELCGMRVLAANEVGVKTLLEHLPQQQGRFPFQLQHHSAFHSPLLDHIPELAMKSLSRNLFKPAEIPLIDGRGKVWQPGCYRQDDLFNYTFDHQICSPYDFTSAISVSLKEFAPDKLIVLGPGTTLGPPIAQQLIELDWLNIGSKKTFTDQQKRDPFVLSMGIEDQRKYVLS
jgi:[acyl-carrier-protein] S-malonyltransferase